MSDTEYVIEKGIPLPRAKKIYSRYPFPQMEVGDSFSVPIEARHTAAAAASGWGPKNGKRFSGRTVPEGYRIWRIE